MGKKWFVALVKKIFVCQSKEKVKGSQRVASPSPRAPSHIIVSAQAQAATSQGITASPIIMTKKESESTLRDYHAAIKIQASFRGYMARKRFRDTKGSLVCFQGVVQRPRIKRQMTTNAVKIIQLSMRAESQNNQSFESSESESMTQARQCQNQKQVWLDLLDRQLHPDQPLKNYRLTPGRTNSSLKLPLRNYKQSYSFLPTSSRSSILMSPKQPCTPHSGRMLQRRSSSSVNKYSISRASRVPNYMAPTVSSKAKVSYWFFQDTRWQGV